MILQVSSHNDNIIYSHSADDKRIIARYNKAFWYLGKVRELMKNYAMDPNPNQWFQVDTSRS